MPKLPKFKTEEEFAEFVDTHDTAPYWNDMATVDSKQFRFMGIEGTSGGLSSERIRIQGFP